MTTEVPISYERFTRDAWEQLTTPVSDRDLEQVTPRVLANIKSFNDEISMADVTAVYAPLVDYIKLNVAQYARKLSEQRLFLGQAQHATPFVIGIAGSVAVGKSTTARLLQYMLQAEFGDATVALTTTDGFLLSNAELRVQGLFNRKGFPESYDMRALIDFLDDVKAGKPIVRSPKYSHEISDVLAGEYDEFNRPEIFIVEGINVLQAPSNSKAYVSDFFDLSIYVDAETDLIEHWYLQRFNALLDRTLAEQDPTNFFWSWTQIPREKAEEIARRVWRDVNLVNLNEYILPTRERADIVLHKSVNHFISEVWLRKF
ncbi:type I pantothenate kinase [Weissella soli]|uniref:type I pantothenate kinase n=1 Tax=Weissella soli TaxID=155866 RepID=UPI0035A13462